MVAPPPPLWGRVKSKYCYCLLLVPIAIACCYCLLLLPIAIAYCCCLLSLPLVIACCCCLLLLPIAIACCLRLLSLPIGDCPLLLPIGVACCSCFSNRFSNCASLLQRAITISSNRPTLQLSSTHLSASARTTASAINSNVSP